MLIATTLLLSTMPLKAYAIKETVGAYVQYLVVDKTGVNCRVVPNGKIVKVFSYGSKFSIHAVGVRGKYNGWNVHEYADGKDCWVKSTKSLKIISH